MGNIEGLGSSGFPLEKKEQQFREKLYLCQKLTSVKYTSMLFANRIRELRENKQMLQRHISAALDIDNAMYCKIERGDRKAKREQIPFIAEMLQADQEELLALWLADQVTAVVESDKEIADKALNIVKNNLKIQI